MRELLLICSVLSMIFLGAAWEGLHVSSFWQPSAVLVVFGSLFAYLLVAVGPKESLNFCSRVLRKKLDSKDFELLERISTLGFLFGGISVVIGFVHVFQNLTETTRIGAGIALALVGLVYGSVPAIVTTLLTGIPPRRSHVGFGLLGATAIIAVVFLSTTIFALSRTNAM